MSTLKQSDSDDNNCQEKDTSEAIDAASDALQPTPDPFPLAQANVAHTHGQTPSESPFGIFDRLMLPIADSIDDNVHLHFLPQQSASASGVMGAANAVGSLLTAPATPATPTPADAQSHRLNNTLTKRRLDQQEADIAALRREVDGWKEKRVRTASPPDIQLVRNNAEGVGESDNAEVRVTDTNAEEIAALRHMVTDLSARLQVLESSQEAKTQDAQIESTASAANSDESANDEQSPLDNTQHEDVDLLSTLPQLQEEMRELKNEVTDLKVLMRGSYRNATATEIDELSESLREFDRQYESKIAQLKTLMEEEREATQRVEGVLERMSAKRTDIVPRSILKKSV